MDVKGLKEEKETVEKYLEGVIRDALIKFRAKTGVQIESISIYLDTEITLSSGEVEYILDSVVFGIAL